MIYDASKSKEIEETIENTTIQGIVELNHNGYIYIFNGQHFGEYGLNYHSIFTHFIIKIDN